MASGAVGVRGKINGITAASDSGRISVQPRTTFAITQDTAAVKPPVNNCYQKPIIDSTATLGWVVGKRGCIDPVPLDPDPGADTAKLGGTVSRVPIGGGPNEGLFYLSALNTQLFLRSQIVQDFWAPDSAARTFPMKGNGTLPSLSCNVTIGFTVNKAIVPVDSGCMGAHGATDERQYLWRHESCHLRLFSLGLATDTNVQRLRDVEALARRDSSLTAGVMRNRLVAIANNIIVKSLHIDSVKGPGYDTLFAMWLPTSESWGFAGTSVKGWIDTTSGC